VTEILPPYIADAMRDAKHHRNFGRDSELGAPAGQRFQKPPPGLSPPVQPTVTVARGELPRPHIRR
jgi:hypothetical protein